MEVTRLEPFNDSSGPSLDHGLELRLAKLDKRLKVTYSPWALDPMTASPIIDALTGQPIAEPAQHLWFRDANGKYRHVEQFLMSEGGFGHLNVSYLEANKRATETYKPGELFRILEQRKLLTQEIERRRHHAHRLDKAQANKKRIADLVFHGKSGRRQAKVSSFPGQVRHSTPGDILTDAREDGWEL